MGIYEKECKGIHIPMNSVRIDQTNHIYLYVYVCTCLIAHVLHTSISLSPLVQVDLPWLLHCL